MRSLFHAAVLVLLALGVSTFGRATEADLPVVRVAVLKYGTANWELDTLREQGFDRRNGFRLEILQRVSPNASLVALQGGAVDFTVSDWLWAARQREAGRPYRYFPYSTAVGELLAPKGAQYDSLGQLAGIELGVAGGPEDKSWLLFQAAARTQDGVELAEQVKPRYAAPPLLNALAERGELGAVLTYWHYAARLKAQGFETVSTLTAVLGDMGIEGEVPMLGWVFSEALAEDKPDLVNAFLDASYAAKQFLLTSDEAWERLRPTMQADDDRVFRELRDGYRAGVPSRFSQLEIASIQRVAKIVRESRAPDPASTSRGVSDQVFWEGFSIARVP